MVNGESCYKGIGYHHRYGRFSAFYVRKAVWQSLLSGAKAGIAYGAHGLCSWHRAVMTFGQVGDWDPPYPWSTALAFELLELEPRQQKLNINSPKIHLSFTKNHAKLAAYVPFVTAPRMDLDLSGYDCTLIDLEERRCVSPSCVPMGKEPLSSFP